MRTYQGTPIHALPSLERARAVDEAISQLDRRGSRTAYVTYKTRDWATTVRYDVVDQGWNLTSNGLIAALVLRLPGATINISIPYTHLVRVQPAPICLEADMNPNLTEATTLGPREQFEALTTEQRASLAADLVAGILRADSGDGWGADTVEEIEETFNRYGVVWSDDTDTDTDTESEGEDDTWSSASRQHYVDTGHYLPATATAADDHPTGQEER